MRIGSKPISINLRYWTAMTLVVLVFASPVTAGLRISASDGIVMTGVDGIVMTGVDGIVMTGVDQFFNANANGIVMTGVDGANSTGSDGIVMTGVDSVAHPYSARFQSADGMNMKAADGIVMTGVDGIVMTGVDGTTYYADAVYVTLPDGIVMTGVDGAQREASDGIVMTGVDGIVMTGVDGLTFAKATAVKAAGADGTVYNVAPEGLRFNDVEGIVMTGVDCIVMTGVDGIVMTGVDGLLPDALNPVTEGLRSVDPQLAAAVVGATDDSNVNAVVVYHNLPTESDIADLQRIGIVGGTRFRMLPAITVTGKPEQIKAIWDLPAVRSVYGNRTLDLNSEPEVRGTTGVTRAWNDSEVTSINSGLPVSGRSVTVAVLDTGIDATHKDLAGRVTKNIKLAGTQSVNVGFNYPVSSDHLANTDQLYGHGTFVAGVIAGGGNASGGKYTGVAPNAKLLGLSAGDLNLFYVLEGFDYLLANAASLNVRVVNCSFSTNGTFDFNDPVNVATKMLTDAGINVVFSAGNNGPSQHTLNPYAAAPWVVSVGSTDTQGRLAKFSSRGAFANSFFHPTLVAPGVDVVSLRGSGVANVTGAVGLVNADSTRLNHSELPYYTTANGTSFSAPQVAGAIALMLETNPNLTPAEVKDVLQRTATPLAPYFTYEAGTGMLNAHAAVVEAATGRRIGTWRGTLDRNQVDFASDAPKTFSGTVQPGQTTDVLVNIPAGALLASVQISWGPLLSTNDLAMSVYDDIGMLRGQSNTLNLTGLNGKREGVTLALPKAGTWKVSVRNTLGGVSTPQKFYGVVEVGRASYTGVTDVSTLNPSLREDIYQSIRSFTMWPIGSKFRADQAISRVDLATSMVIGARVPQYLPAQASYKDIGGDSNRVFVESVQAAPTGALFGDVTQGGNFRPNDNATRLVAAVALVRAAGLRAEAESYSGPLTYLDAGTIPSSLKGYVAVAVSKGLMESGSSFRPNEAFTRGDLARAVAVIQRRAVE